MDYPMRYKIGGAAIIGSRVVETIYPARRCAAPGCGDKIKGDGETIELTLSTKPRSKAFVHASCFDEEACGVIDWAKA